MTTRLGLRVLLVVAAAVSADHASAQSEAVPPVTVPYSQQYDIRSKITGETYRLMVAGLPDVKGPLPVLYVLDGNSSFLTAAQAALAQALGGAIRPGLVVAVGYPVEQPAEMLRRRTYDLTPTVATDPAETRKTGGGEAFLRVLEEEVKPFIAARYSVDARNQAIFGHSFGGLLVLHSLLTNPGRYAAYVISSPSIWWNNRDVIKREDGLASRLPSGVSTRVLVLSAGAEQYRGDDPVRRAADTRMVDDATELAERLRRVGPALVVDRVVFADELHLSVVPAALSRAVRFAFAK